MNDFYDLILPREIRFRAGVAQDLPALLPVNTENILFIAGNHAVKSGDAAGIVVLTRKTTAEKEQLPILAQVSGSGMSSDAVHITAPDPEGNALQSAIRTALKHAKRNMADIGAVIGHGTGTVYNDSMEIHALQSFGVPAIPLVSVKGSTGHTLAGAGLIQLAMALRMLEEKRIPPQTSLETPEPGGESMLSKETRPLENPCILSMNSGFGGMNSVLLLEGVK